MPPTDVSAVQDSPTSILVSWTPPSAATGYRIHYIDSDGVDSGNVTVSSGTNSYIILGLLNGQTYNISIMATFNGQFSDWAETEPIGLGKPSLR